MISCQSRYFSFLTLQINFLTVPIHAKLMSLSQEDQTFLSQSLVSKERMKDSIKLQNQGNKGNFPYNGIETLHIIWLTMGNQTCSTADQTPPNAQYQFQTEFLGPQPNLPLEQDSDNPLHQKHIQSLNSKSFLASNALMEHSYRPKPSLGSAIPHHKQEKLTKGLNPDKNKHPEKKVINMLKKNRRCSIQQNFQSRANSFLSFYMKHKAMADTIPSEACQKERKPQKNQFLARGEKYKQIEIRTEEFVKLNKGCLRKHYRFLEKVGQGSYGHVHKALCLRSKQFRAIKSLKQKLIPRNKKNQIILEIEILRQLDHSNIIKIFQVFEENSTYHVVTEFCEGGSLIDLALKRKFIDQTVVKVIFRQVLSALNYMHAHQIVHRDLKLENIVLLNPSAENIDPANIEVKLIDFGSAHKLKEYISSCRGPVGTTSYMAPQILKGYFDTKCDIWSAGVILYILLTGKTPFKCNKREDTLLKIQHYQLEFKGPEWRHVSQGAVELVKKMLCKNPSERVSAAEALAVNWLAQQKEKDSLEKKQELLSDLSKYHRKNNFVSKIESYLAFVKVSQTERKRIADLFRSLDKDENGLIELEELLSVYGEQLDKEQKEATILLLSRIDKNKSGKIQLSEFIAALCNKSELFVRDYLEEAFDYFDLDGTGYIEKEELQGLLAGSQAKEIESFLREIDQNGDQRISKEEFLDYLLPQYSLSNT